MLAMPAATPNMNRATINIIVSADKALKMLPPMKIKPPSIKTFRRSIFFSIAVKTTIDGSAPNSKNETTNPFSAEFKPKAVVMDGKASEIAPES